MPCLIPFHPDNPPNDLWRNLGGNQFIDVSDTSAIRDQDPNPELNRDGVGSIVSLTQKGGLPNKRPTGQSTYLSQDELTFSSGLGDANRATVDVFWPGSVRNRRSGGFGGNSIPPFLQDGYEAYEAEEWSDLSVFCASPFTRQT